MIDIDHLLISAAIWYQSDCTTTTFFKFAVFLASVSMLTSSSEYYTSDALIPLISLSSDIEYVHWIRPQNQQIAVYENYSKCV